MHSIDRTSSLYQFFLPFFEDRVGRILGLGSPREHMRDGQAIVQLARIFSIPYYEGIEVEPGRPTIQPTDNMILCGRAELFIDPSRYSGDDLPLSLGEVSLGERVRRIDRECCFRVVGDKDRAVVNTVTGKKYRPSRDPGRDVEVDYGIIRRLFRSGVENTVIVEGPHRLGTLGAAMVVTNQVALNKVSGALRDIDDFDPSLPLEILVKAEFRPRRSDGVYGLKEVRVSTLCVVYNRQWISFLDGNKLWRDQLPWDVHLWIEGNNAPLVPSAEARSVLPRFEVSADLSHLDRPTRELCRKVVATAGASKLPRRTEDRILDVLTREVNRFRLELIERGHFGGTPRRTLLPEGESKIRTLRKQFILHMILCRLFSRTFECTEESVRRVFRDYEPKSRSKTLRQQFVAAVSGKRREGFEPLFGAVKDRKGYVVIDAVAKAEATNYSLRLGVILLRFKLRLGVDDELVQERLPKKRARNKRAPGPAPRV